MTMFNDITDEMRDDDVIGKEFNGPGLGFKLSPVKMKEETDKIGKWFERFCSSFTDWAGITNRKSP